MESQRVILPPHNNEAEEAVLGSILIDPECFTEVRGIIEAGDFFREKNQWVFQAMEALSSLNFGIDYITVAEELTGKGRLEEIGGLVYLSHLASQTPTSVHARYYAHIIAQKAMARRMIAASGQIAAMAYKAEGDGLGLFLQAQDILSRLEPQDSSEIVGPREHAEAMLKMVATKREHRGQELLFGYRDLDKFIGGLYGGNLIIIGARPGMGKSQLMQEIAIYNANRDKKVMIASAEMSLAEFDEREIAMSGIDIRELRRGELKELEWDRIQDVVAEVSERPCYFLEGKLGVDNIWQKARLLQRTKGLDLLLVDYIQLLRDRTERKAGDTLRERIGYISNGLKSLARDLRIPVIAASQLRREVEGRQDKRPTLSDLKESGDLEQDADVVLLLHRPEIYEANKEKGILHIYIAKVRQIGEVGAVELKWIPKAHRYFDLAKEE